MTDPYKIMGHIYDVLGSLYSGRRIPHCKEAMVDRLKPGDEVLFAGVGHGRDAIKAAEAGARVTVVDLSGTMLDKFNKLIENKKFDSPITQLHENIFNVSSDHQYDFVFANFFLNVFKRDMMDKMVGHLADLTKPGGHMVVGDFAFPCGSAPARAFQRVYWYIGVTPFFLMTNNAFHNIYNYPEYLKKYGLKIAAIRYFKIVNLKCYWSILAQKPA